MTGSEKVTLRIEDGKVKMLRVVGTMIQNSFELAESETDVIAVVLGKKITVAEKDQLDGIIFNTLLQEYATKHEIEPTEAELDAFVVKMEENEKQIQAEFEADRERLRRELQSDALSARDREEKESELEVAESMLATTRELEIMTEAMAEQMRPMKRQMARQFVRSWKINKALYDQYGGRVIFQQAGVEPLDAFREFLRAQEKNGAFQILDKQVEAGFWNYFTNDAMHTFYPEEEGAEFIRTPWWMMEHPPGE